MNHQQQKSEVAMTAEEWLEYGFKHGYCGPPVCVMHDGIPATESEAFMLEDENPCIYILRLYENSATKSEVERQHDPSISEAARRGWA